MLSERVSRQFEQRMLKESSILERDARLRHKKEEEQVKLTAKQLEQERLDIDESRQHQLRCKVQKQEAEKVLADLCAEDLTSMTLRQQEFERQKKITERAQNIELRKIHQQQIRENEQRRAKDKLDAFKDEQQVSFCQMMVSVSINRRAQRLIRMT